jgi:hypothetical protein
MYDMGWTKRHWSRLSASTLVSPASSPSTNCFIFINHLTTALLNNKLYSTQPNQLCDASASGKQRTSQNVWDKFMVARIIKTELLLRIYEIKKM